MNEEQKLGLGFLLGMIVIVGFGAWASFQTKSTPASVTSIESLPLAQDLYWDHLTPEVCEEAGGIIRYERTSECHSSPNVREFCSPLLLCFDDRQDSTCYDVKRPYCYCESDDQCPDGYRCDGKGKNRACHQY